MGRCLYRFNASEHYQRTPPGCAPETHCAAETYPIYDEPEVIYRMVQDATGAVTYTGIESGVYLPRGTDDPHCPAHGGTPRPDTGVIHMFLQREFERKQGELDALKAQLGAQAAPDLLALGGVAPDPAAAPTPVIQPAAAAYEVGAAAPAAPPLLQGQAEPVSGIQEVTTNGA